MQEDTLSPVVVSKTAQPESSRSVSYFYPDEGFGNVYRRSMLNDLFTDLIRRSNIHTVAEVPLESYGIVGAGSLIFTQLGCDVTMVSDDQELLNRAQALMKFNGVTDAKFLHSPLIPLELEDNAYDFTWNFDELLPLEEKEAFLAEQCRISKAAFVVVPSAYSYGQVMHYLYHKLTRTTCMHAGPRSWMYRKPIREAMKRNGMDVVKEGIIDVPWWPSFPELPNMVRSLLGRETVQVDKRGIPEANPNYVRPEDLPATQKRVRRSGIVELGRYWPKPVKYFFAHNIYVLGCKPEYREELGL